MTNTTPSPPDLWDELSLANSALLRASYHINMMISDHHPVLQSVLMTWGEAGKVLASHGLAPAIPGTDSCSVARPLRVLLAAGSVLLEAAEVIADEEGVNEHAQDALQAAGRANRAVKCHLQARGLLQGDAGGDGDV